MLFGGRKARYLPLAINNVRGIEEIPYRIVMLGDYSSGISLLRNELVQLNSFKDIPFAVISSSHLTVILYESDTA